MDEKDIDRLIEFMKDDKALCTAAMHTDRALTPDRQRKLNSRLAMQDQVIEVLWAYKGLLK